MSDVYRVQSTDVHGWNIGEVDLHVHDSEQCEGQACCIHHPSDHAMVAWPQLWRNDKKMMERICPHGQGHPDPDGFYTKGCGFNCDGCCRQAPTPELEPAGDRIRMGGLMRCCIQTLRERTKPGQAGEIQPCNWCSSSMRWTEGVWEWAQDLSDGRQ